MNAPRIPRCGECRGYLFASIALLVAGLILLMCTATALILVIPSAALALFIVTHDDHP